MTDDVESWKEAYKRLNVCCVKVMQAAVEAHFSMPKSKVTSMSMADKKCLRDLGSRISEMDSAMIENDFRLDQKNEQVLQPGFK